MCKTDYGGGGGGGGKNDPKIDYVICELTGDTRKIFVSNIRNKY